MPPTTVSEACPLDQRTPLLSSSSFCLTEATGRPVAYYGRLRRPPSRSPTSRLVTAYRTPPSEQPPQLSGRGVDLDGIKHVLGIWVQSVEGAKFWAEITAKLAKRGVRDLLIACCDG